MDRYQFQSFRKRYQNAYPVKAWRMSALAIIIFAILVGCQTSTLEFIRKGEESEKQKNYEEAISWYTKAKNANPHSTFPGLRLASVYLALNRVDDALAEIQRALGIIREENKTSPQAPVTRVEEAETYFLFGKALGQSGKPSEAIRYYEQSRALVPNRLDYRLALFSAYVESGRLEDAARVSNEDPDIAAQHLLLGLSYLKTGNYLHAEEEFHALHHHVEASYSARVLHALASLGNPVEISAGGVADFPKLYDARSELALAEKARPNDFLVVYARARLKEVFENSGLSLRLGNVIGLRDVNRDYAAAIRAPFDIDSVLGALVRNSTLREPIQNTLKDVAADLQAQARMAYKRTLASLSSDKTPPTLSVDTEMVPPETDFGFAIISGKASDDQLVDSIIVNEAPVYIRRLSTSLTQTRQGDEVEFVAKVELTVGSNTIAIRAMDGAGNSTAKEIQIARRVQAYPSNQQSRYALLISVIGYQDAKVSSRSAAKEDSQKLIARLSDGIPSNQIETLTGAEATKANILKVVDALAEIPESQAQELLVYFDVWVRLRSIGTEEQPYFLPYDVQADDLLGTAIDAREIVKRLGEVKARSLVIVVHGSYGERIFQEGSWRQERTGRVIFAATEGRAVLPPQLGNRSPFLRFMLEALDSLASEDPSSRVAPCALPPGSLSLLRVFDYTKRRTLDLTGGRWQPLLIGDLNTARCFLFSSVKQDARILEELAKEAVKGRLDRESLLRLQKSLVSKEGQASDGQVRQLLQQYSDKTITIEQVQSALKTMGTAGRDNKR